MKKREEIGEWWDRLGPYTESDCEMVQIAMTAEEGRGKSYLNHPCL